MFGSIVKSSRGLRAMTRSTGVRNAAEALAHADRAYKSTRIDRLHSFWVNGLLSGPTTLARNATANLATLTTRPLETISAASISKLSREAPERSVYYQEAIHEMSGGINSLVDSFKVAGKAFKGPDATRKAAIEMGLPKDLFKNRKWEDRNPWSEKALSDTWFGMPTKYVEKFVTSPGQVLQGTDNFFKVMNYRMSMRKHLARKAISEGVSGYKNIAMYIENGLRNPDDIYNSRAILDAEKATFTDQWNSETMESFDKILGNKVFRWITPFRRAPAKILKYSLQRSPAALLDAETRQAIRVGGVHKAEAYGRMVTGSAMAATLSYLLSDRISGRAPIGAQQRAMWEAAGNKEYTVRFGGKNIKFDAFGPVGLVMRIVADYTDGVRNIDLDNDQDGWSLMGELATVAALPWVTAIRDMSFLRSFGDLVGAAEKAHRYEDSSYIMRIASTFAASFVWSGVSAMAHEYDPILRDPKNPIEQAMTRMPGLTRQIPERHNLFGEPILYSSLVGPENQPFAVSQDGKDPLSAYLINELNWDAPRLTRRIDGVKLTQEEYSQYSRLAGQGANGLRPLRKVMQETIEAMRSAGASEAHLTAVLNRLVSRYREAARNAMRRDPRFNIAEREAKLLRR